VTRLTRQGHADWGDLIGKTFEFLFYPGWDEPEWLLITLEEVYLTENEFDTPVYYLMDREGSGYMQYESTIVEVRIV